MFYQIFLKNNPEILLANVFRVQMDTYYISQELRGSLRYDDLHFFKANVTKIISGLTQANNYHGFALLIMEIKTKIRCTNPHFKLSVKIG